MVYGLGRKAIAVALLKRISRKTEAVEAEVVQSLNATRQPWSVVDRRDGDPEIVHRQPVVQADRICNPDAEEEEARQQRLSHDQLDEIQEKGEEVRCALPARYVTRRCGTVSIRAWRGGSQRVPVSYGVRQRYVTRRDARPQLIISPSASLTDRRLC